MSTGKHVVFGVETSRPYKNSDYKRSLRFGRDDNVYTVVLRLRGFLHFVHCTHSSRNDTLELSCRAESRNLNRFTKTTYAKNTKL